MNFSEEILAFSCAGERLQGVLARPALPASCGVLVLVGGPQYRVGSHRQFLLLARRLAAAGHAVARFDYRGMGDSEGAARSFEQVSDDVAAALDAFREACPQVEKVVLWGLCDAASAALLYCGERRDPRVAGLCLLNPWVRSDASLARTQVKHYYGQRLLQREFWAKLARGQVPLLAAARGFAGSLRRAAARRTAVAPGAAASRPFPERMGAALRDFPGRVLLLLSGNDYVAREFADYAVGDPVWRAALAQPRVARIDAAGADHTFSSASGRALVERSTLEWLACLAD